MLRAADLVGELPRAQIGEPLGWSADGPAHIAVGPPLVIGAVDGRGRRAAPRASGQRAPPRPLRCSARRSRIYEGSDADADRALLKSAAPRNRAIEALQRRRVRRLPGRTNYRQAPANLISGSYLEPQNLTMRMSMRRFTRLTNAFSKKVENHAAAIALYFMYYNFGRVHQTLRVTPAMEAGVSDHVWSIEEIVRLLEGR